MNEPRVAVAANFEHVGKLAANDTRWGAFNGAFKNVVWPVSRLFEHIRAGKAFTTQHRRYRKAENFLKGQAICLDFDTEDEKSSFEHLLTNSFIRNSAYALYTTASHRPEAPRTRVLFVMDRPTEDRGQYTELAEALVYHFGLADEKCKDACRVWFGALDCEIQVLGNVLTWDTATTQMVLPLRAKKEAEAKKREQERRKREEERARRLAKGLEANEAQIAAYAMKVLEGETRELANTRLGNRHKELLGASIKLGGLLKADWLPAHLLREEEVWQELTWAAEQNGLLAEDGEDNIEQTIRDGIAYATPREEPIWRMEERKESRPAPPEPPAPPPYDPWTGERYKPSANGHKPTFRLYTMADMWDQQEGVQRAWGGWILQNNITLIGGVSNVGKSPLLLAIVAGFLRGQWPDGTMVPPSMKGRNVVYCIPEGYGEQTELLLDWGFEREEIARRVFMPALPTPGAEEVPNYVFKLDAGGGMEVLRYYCEQTDPALIVIDGLRAAMSGEESSSQDVDRFFSPLVQLTAKHSASLLLSHHLTKGSESASRDGAIPSLDWFRGSGHIVAACRSAWIVDQPNPMNLEQRRITLVKAAAGPKGQMMAFEMADPAHGLTFLSDVPKAPPKSKKEAAERFILQMLREEPMSHDELWRRCQEEPGLDCSEATFRDARVELSNSHRIVQVIHGRTYLWTLPGPPEPEAAPWMEGFEEVPF